jgi:hypothetical protein
MSQHVCVQSKGEDMSLFCHSFGEGSLKMIQSSDLFLDISLKNSMLGG